PTGRTGFGSHTPARWPVTGRPTRPGRNRCHMYVTITHGPHHPTTVYGPIDDRHPPAAAGTAQSAITVPLHAAGAVTDISTVLPSVSRISRRTATAIAHATPALDQAGPVALLVVAPSVRLVIAIGPFATAALSHTWRRQRTDLP